MICSANEQLRLGGTPTGCGRARHGNFPVLTAGSWGELPVAILFVVRTKSGRKSNHATERLGKHWKETVVCPALFGRNWGAQPFKSGSGGGSQGSDEAFSATRSSHSRTGGSPGNS